jgi:FkbM family methyltransferase
VKNLRQRGRDSIVRLFGSLRGQQFLDRIASHIDFWRGYGSGAYIESSGEAVLFKLVRQRNDQIDNLVIFDVGANVGNFSATAFETLGRNITVHAFEPARDTFQKLSVRFVGNDHIILNNVALGREAGDRPLFGFARDSGMASLLHRRLSDAETSVVQEKVKVVCLNNYCLEKQVDKIDVLKIDVEGFELEVLSGADRLFKEGRIDICSFEFGGCNLDSRTFLRDFFDFFQAHRMEIFRITPAMMLVPLPRYSEQLENFTITNYVATRAT